MTEIDGCVCVCVCVCVFLNTRVEPAPALRLNNLLKTAMRPFHWLALNRLPFFIDRESTNQIFPLFDWSIALGSRPIK